MRLAWFSPWPPDRSGVAGRSAELVLRLTGRGHGIDVFVDDRRVPVRRTASPDPPAAGSRRVLGAHDFVWREARGQYDQVVYQIGNSSLHEFIWPYLYRWPGLAVLHEARLHHARGRALLARKREDDYRAEFRWNHPDVQPDAAELAVKGFGGAYYYQWPMTRTVVESARLVATHSRGAFAELTEAWPDRPIEYIALGEGRRDRQVDRRRVRADLRIPDSALVFGVFGAITAERRIDAILGAFAAIRAHAPDAKVLLAGAPDPVLDVPGIARGLGVADALILHGALGDDAFDEAIAAVDVSLNLRWPTALEVSGPWLRALAAARPTVIVDLAHLAHVPTLDPRTWRPPAPAGPHPPEPVAVAIDILDEDHSLRLALRRLATDPALRAALGAAGRRFWEAEHTVERMVADYERALIRAVSLPPPAVVLPAHLRPDPMAHARTLAAEIGEGLIKG
jgi:glycosyltransferase involved in cell wall biosynthesis